MKINFRECILAAVRSGAVEVLDWLVSREICHFRVSQVSNWRLSGDNSFMNDTGTLYYFAFEWGHVPILDILYEKDVSILEYARTAPGSLHFSIDILRWLERKGYQLSKLDTMRALLTCSLNTYNYMTERGFRLAQADFIQTTITDLFYSSATRSLESRKDDDYPEIMKKISLELITILEMLKDFGVNVKHEIQNQMIHSYLWFHNCGHLTDIWPYLKDNGWVLSQLHQDASRSIFWFAAEAQRHVSRGSEAQQKCIFPKSYDTSSLEWNHYKWKNVLKILQVSCSARRNFCQKIRILRRSTMLHRTGRFRLVLGSP